MGCFPFVGADTLAGTVSATITLAIAICTDAVCSSTVCSNTSFAIPLKDPGSDYTITLEILDNDPINRPLTLCLNTVITETLGLVPFYETKGLGPTTGLDALKPTSL